MSLSVYGWTPVFLLDVHRLCAIGGRLSHLLPRWLRAGRKSLVSQENIPEILRHGCEAGLRRGQTVRHVYSPLSYHDSLNQDERSK